MKKILEMGLTASVLGMMASTANADGILAPQNTDYFKQLHVNIHVGAFQNDFGEAQQIRINLVDNARYTVSSHNNWNALFGLGLFKDDTMFNALPLSYGVTAFYLAKTSVTGQIYQANLFNNLGYTYDVTNVPIYAMGKTYVNLFSTGKKLALDVGIGANIMRLSGYKERINNPQTIPDNAFASNTETNFSTTIGIGLHFDNLVAKTPIECGYRFFYLGSGKLKINNDQYLTSLSAGTAYANAVTCSLII